MIKSFNANENNIDKASKLRETNIFKHKDLLKKYYLKI